MISFKKKEVYDLYLILKKNIDDDTYKKNQKF